MPNLLTIKKVLESTASTNSKTLAMQRIIDAERKEMYDMAYELGRDDGYDAGYENAYTELADKYGFDPDETIEELEETKALVSVPNYGVESPYNNA